MVTPQDRDYLAETGFHQSFIAVHALPRPIMVRRLDLDSTLLRYWESLVGTNPTRSRSGQSIERLMVLFNIAALSIRHVFRLRHRNPPISQIQSRGTRIADSTGAFGRAALSPQDSFCKKKPRSTSKRCRRPICESLRPDLTLPRERIERQRSESRSQSDSSDSTVRIERKMRSRTQRHSVVTKMYRVGHLLSVLFFILFSTWVSKLKGGFLWFGEGDGEGSRLRGC